MNVKVVYIAGQGRSGSTVLDRVLGSLDGVSSFNEIYRIWLEGFVQNNRCSCGVPFKACGFWTRVVNEALGNGTDWRHIMRLHRSIDRSRHFPKIFAGSYGPRFERRLDEYKECLRRLYLAIAKISGKSVIVDSSKVPARALLLTEIPDLDVHVIHLVRDPRAIIYSWRRRKFNPAHGGPLPQYAPLRTLSFWMVRNILCELLSRKSPYVRVRYEDFARRPRGVSEAITARIEPLRGKRVPFEDESTIHLSSLHTMGGNPDRFQSGLTRIRPDEQWKKGLDPRTRQFATLVSYPLLARYGYPVGRGQTME